MDAVWGTPAGIRRRRVGSHLPGMVPPVAGACVIGVDVGGTKLLAGAVDADLAVHHRAQRSSQDLATGELLDVLAEMVREAADAAPTPVLGVGFGICRVRSTPATASSRPARTCRSRACASRR